MYYLHQRTAAGISPPFSVTDAGREQGMCGPLEIHKPINGTSSTPSWVDSDMMYNLLDLLLFILLLIQKVLTLEEAKDYREQAKSLSELQIK